MPRRVTLNLVLFPRLPVLEAFVDRFKASQPLRGVALVGVQHLLETTGSLVEALYCLGLKPANAFLLGKAYSSCREVASKLTATGAQVVEHGNRWRPGHYEKQLSRDVRRLWHEVLAKSPDVETLIVLDDGGHAIVEAPDEARQQYNVVGVEQTTSGVTRTGLHGLLIPVVEVATSAAKTLMERPMIREAVFDKLPASLTAGPHKYGVIGIGNIGSAVAEGLVRSGQDVRGYDVRPGSGRRVRGLKRVETFEEVWTHCDVIFGCTGQDCLGQQTAWRELSASKTLISCSSQDKEFASVLQSCDEIQMNSLHDLTITVGGGRIEMIRGGFPANFDGSAESVPGRDIQLTRGLLLGGVLQAVLGLGGEEPGGFRLSAAVQQFVIRKWLEAEPARCEWYPRPLIASFNDCSTIELHSGGNSVSSDCLELLNERATCRANSSSH